jgi:hypothetical protein
MLLSSTGTWDKTASKKYFRIAAEQQRFNMILEHLLLYAL